MFESIVSVHHLNHHIRSIVENERRQFELNDENDRYDYYSIV